MLLEAEHGVLPSTSVVSVGGGKRLGDTILYGCTMDSKSACVRLVKPFLPYFWFPGLTAPRLCVCVFTPLAIHSQQFHSCHKLTQHQLELRVARAVPPMQH